MIGRLSSRFSSFWLHLRNWINILNQNPQHKTPVITAVKETNKSWWQSGDIHNYYSYGIVFSACTHAHSHTQSVGNIYGSLAIEFELRPQLEGVWRSTGLVPKAGPKVLSSFEVAATAVAVAFEVHGLIGRASRRCKPISPGFLIGSRGLVWRGEAEMQTAKVALATHFIKVNSYLHEKCLPLKLINGFTLILQLKIDAAAAAVRRASTSPIWICPPVETMDRKGRSKTRDWIIEGSRSRSHLATWPKTEIALKIECLAGGACNPQIIYDIKSRDSKRRLMPDKGKGQRINCNLCFFSASSLPAPKGRPCAFFVAATRLEITEKKPLHLRFIFCARFDYQPLHLHSQTQSQSPFPFSFEFSLTIFHLSFSTAQTWNPFWIFSVWVTAAFALFICWQFFAHLAACIYHLRIIRSTLNGIIYLPDWELSLLGQLLRLRLRLRLLLALESRELFN